MQHAAKPVHSGVDPVVACRASVVQALTDDRDMPVAVNELSSSLFRTASVASARRPAVKEPGANSATNGMPSVTAKSRPGSARATLPTRHGGFTIVEIMLAAVILGILTAIALPLYENHITEARIATAIKDIRQISLILDDRYLDNDPPATLADVGVNLVDPWGNPYQYLWLRGNPAPGVNGARRRDKSLNPVNTDYDLYSMGADGLTVPQFAAGKAKDDVVRANDGDFVGLADDH